MSSENSPLVARATVELPKSVLFAYGAGTVLEDATGALTLAYLLYFLTEVRGLAPVIAGCIFAIGQASDALFTPLAGVFSDALKKCLGHHKYPVVAGGILELLAFALLFLPCYSCGALDMSTEAAQILHYGAAISLWNLSYAAVQDAHLGLVRHISQLEDQRLLLTSFRYFFCILANILVFSLAGPVFWYSGSDLEPAYRHVVLGTCAVSLVSLLWFSLGVPIQPSPSVPAAPYQPAPPAEPEAPRGDVQRGQVGRCWWLSHGPFYQGALIYVCMRLVVVLNQVLLPFYLMEWLGMPPISLALVPLIAHLASFVTTYPVYNLNESLGRRGTCLIGAVLCISASGMLYLLEPSVAAFVYVVAALFGVGSTILSVTTLMIQADVLGDHFQSASFVSALYGVLEKLSVAAIVVILATNGFLPSGPHVRLALAILPAATSFVCSVVSCTLPSKAHPPDLSDHTLRPQTYRSPQAVPHPESNQYQYDTHLSPDAELHRQRSQSVAAYGTDASAGGYAGLAHRHQTQSETLSDALHIAVAGRRATASAVVVMGCNADGHASLATSAPTNDSALRMSWGRSPVRHGLLSTRGTTAALLGMSPKS